MNRKIVVEHGDQQYTGQIGTIRSTALGYEGHGILTAYLAIEWPGGGISVGGYALDLRASQDRGDYSRKGTAYGLDHIIRLMETVGVDSWEKLPGQKVMVLFEGSGWLGSTAAGIAHAEDESKVLILKEHAEMWREVTA